MSLLSIPQMVSAGSLTFTLDSRAVTGDNTTLYAVEQGMEIFVPGYDDIFTAAEDATENGDFDMVEIWPNANATVTCYVFNEALEETVKAILSEVGASGAFGLYSGRSAYNAQSAGFLYLSRDGAGGATFPVLYERVTSTSGKWRAVEDPPEIDDEGDADNAILNPQGYVTDPYIDDDAKVDLDPLQHTPWYVLSQADDVTEADSTSDVTFSRGLKITKTTNAGRMGVCQIITKADMPHLFDVALTFSAKVRLSAGGDCRFAILSDTLTDYEPKDVVNDWTSTTYDADGYEFFVDEDSLVVEAVGEIQTAAADPINFAIQTDDTVASSSQGRIILFIWTEASQSTSATLEITDVVLKVGGGIPKPSKPQPVETVKVPVRTFVSSVDVSQRNRIRNPSGTAKTTSTTIFPVTGIADNSYINCLPWLVYSQTDSIAANSEAVTSINLNTAIKVTQTNADGSANHRCGLAQHTGAYEFSLAANRDLRGKNVVLSAWISANPVRTMRYAVITSTNFITADIINDWTSTTYSAGNFFVTTSGLKVVATDSITLATADTFERIILTAGPLDSDINYLTVIFWSEATMGQNHYFHVSSAVLEQGLLPTNQVGFLSRLEALSANLDIPQLTEAPDVNDDDYVAYWNTGTKTLNRCAVGDLVSSSPTITTLESGNLSGTNVSLVEDSVGLWATYRELHLTVSGASIDTATRQTLVLVSTDSGSSYATSNYQGVTQRQSAGALQALTTELARNVTQTAAQTGDLWLQISGHQGGTYCKCIFVGNSAGATEPVAGTSTYIGSTSAINALQIDVGNGSGSFDAGTYSLVGVR